MDVDGECDSINNDGSLSAPRFTSRRVSFDVARPPNSTRVSGRARLTNPGCNKRLPTHASREYDRDEKIAFYCEGRDAARPVLLNSHLIKFARTAREPGQGEIYGPDQLETRRSARREFYGATKPETRLPSASKVSARRGARGPRERGFTVH